MKSDLRQQAEMQLLLALFFCTILDGLSCIFSLGPAKGVSHNNREE
jgi:hypothetical protein